MLNVLNYIWQFITVVLVGCMSPANWKACLPVHQWLPPYAQQLNGIQLREEHKQLQRNLLP